MSSKTNPSTDAPKRGRGRPSYHPEPMERHNVHLDLETVVHARVLGDGNLAKGLREAVKRVFEELK